MPLPSLVRREWHVVYQFPLAVGLITALNLAVTVWWDWSGVEGEHLLSRSIRRGCCC